MNDRRYRKRIKITECSGSIRYKKRRKRKRREKERGKNKRRVNKKYENE